MIVTTQIPCGNGRIRWIKPGHFEVELIAYSKHARYTHFRISDVKEARQQEIILRPDAYFPATFPNFHSKIWIRRGDDGEWLSLPEEQVQIAPEVIRFPVDLYPNENLYISTEPPRPYAETTQELFQIHQSRPLITSLECIGHSIEQRPMFCLSVTNDITAAASAQKPVVHVSAGEHATEFSGEEIARGMLQLVLSDSPVAQSLRDQFRFDFILNCNPDGNFHGWHQYNASDWLAHNYADGLDRSWHHEFEPYFMGELDSPSPETVAVAEHIKASHPVFLLSLHSWLGHHGNPGAFHADAHLLSPAMGKKLSLLNALAKEVAKDFDVEFETYPSSNLCAGHIGTYLMKNDITLAYTIEGHMNLGRQNLQNFGAQLLQTWLAEKQLQLI